MFHEFDSELSLIDIDHCHERVRFFCNKIMFISIDVHLKIWNDTSNTSKDTKTTYVEWFFWKLSYVGIFFIFTNIGQFL
jgi:hypothetical protein